MTAAATATTAATAAAAPNVGALIASEIRDTRPTRCTILLGITAQTRVICELETADCAYPPQNSHTQLSSTTHGTAAAGRAGNVRKYAWAASQVLFVKLNIDS